MKLPTVQNRGVEGLAQLSPQNEASVAASPFQTAQKVIGAAYESWDHYELLQDQENAITEANRSNAVTGVLKQLENPEVNLGLLPADAIKAYEASAGYDDTLHGVMQDTGEVFAPSHKVGQAVFDWANSQLSESNNRLRSGRAQGLYNENIGEEIKSSFEIANAGIRTSQVNTLRNQTDVAITQASDQGNTEVALSLINNANLSGLLSDSMVDQREKEVYKKAFETFDNNMGQLTTDVYNAAFDGVPDAMLSLGEQVKAEFDRIGKHGTKIADEKQLNDYVRKYKLAAQSGLIAGKAADIYADKGFTSTMEHLEGLDAELANQLPDDVVSDGLTVKDMQGAISAARSRIQQRENVNKAATKETTKAAVLRKDSANVFQAVADFGGVPKKGAANKSWNNLSDQFLPTLYKNEPNPLGQKLTRFQVRESAIGWVLKGKNLPTYMQNKFDQIINLPSEEAIEVARDYAYLRANNPEVARQYTGKYAGLMNQAATSIELGHDFGNSEAFMEQLKERFADDPETFELNIKRLTEEGEFNTGNLEKVRKDIFEDYNPWFSGNPDVSAYLNRKADEQYKYYRGQGLTKEAAIEASKTSFGDLGVSKTNPDFPDGHLMIMSPESVVGGWSLDQWNELKAKQFPDKKAEGLFLRTDGKTMYGETPSWSIWYKDPDKPESQAYRIKSTAREGATYTRFMPDYTKTQEAKNAVNAFELDVKDGTFLRDQRKIMQDAVTKGMNESLQGDFSPREYNVSSMQVYSAMRKNIEALKKDETFYKTVVNDKKKYKILGGIEEAESKPEFDEKRWEQFEDGMLSALASMLRVKRKEAYPETKEKKEDSYIRKGIKSALSGK